jgi:hypothetical protein
MEQDEQRWYNSAGMTADGLEGNDSFDVEPNNGLRASKLGGIA